jgi:putative transposase
VKWKNIDIGAAYYYITGTFTEWLPLLRNADVREIVCQEITRALQECEGTLTAFVLMPDHVHILVYLPDAGRLHGFNKLWRGRSARRITQYAEERGSTRIMEIMARHANGGSRYAVWKEQPRSLPIYSEQKLHAMVNYIHANPVRRGLVSEPGQWEFSSWRFYERGECVQMDVTPPIL